MLYFELQPGLEPPSFKEWMARKKIEDREKLTAAVKSSKASVDAPNKPTNDSEKVSRMLIE